MSASLGTKWPVTKWWWVRHAPVADAHLRRLSGQADVAADTSDTDAFKALAPHLPRDAIWVTTPLRRTGETSHALIEAGVGRVTPLIEPAFVEQAFGDWTNCTWDELAENEDAKAFWDAPATVAPPKLKTNQPSESFADLCTRVGSRIEELTEHYAGRDIICVAHAGSIRAAVALALGLGPAQALGLAVQNLSLTRLEHISAGRNSKRPGDWGGNWRVVGLNQIC